MEYVTFPHFIFGVLPLLLLNNNSLSRIIFLGRYHILYTYFPTATHLGCFHLLATELVCLTSVKILYKHIFEPVSRSFSYKSRSEIPGSFGNSMFSLGNCPDVFPNSRALPVAMDKGFDFSTFLLCQFSWAATPDYRR